MWARISYFAALLVATTVTIAVQLDRYSARAPAIAWLTPEPVRSFAQAQIASISLIQDQPEAVAEAQKLVIRRPIPAENLRLLAQAQFTAGQDDLGFVTIQIAAQRGWRDPAAQEALLRMAAAAGDDEQAAKRFIALFLRPGTTDALLQEFDAQLFGDTDSSGVATLSQIVADSPRWRSAFVLRGARVLPSAAYVEILENVTASNVSIECDQLRLGASNIAQGEEYLSQRIEILLSTHC